MAFSVDDILKLLGQIPAWKDVPARLAAAEARIAELEKRLAVAPGPVCPACGAPALRKTGQEPLTGDVADLNAYGGRIEVWACGNCGTEDRKTVLPGR